MVKIIEEFSFHDSFESEWKNFISPLPSDSTAAEIRECCAEIYRKMKTLFTTDPGYQTQLDIYLKWKTLEDALEAENPHALPALQWFARQLVNMVMGNDFEVRESTWYALSVNYFECGMDGYWLLPIMFALLPEDEKAGLIRITGSIDWDGKIATYREAARTPGLHEELGDALRMSCQAYCIGAIKPAEALPFVQKLTLLPHIMQFLTQKLTAPIAVVITEVVELDRPNENGILSFVSVQSVNDIIPTWFPYCELKVEDLTLASVPESVYDLDWPALAEQYGFEPPEGGGKIIGLKHVYQEVWRSLPMFLVPIS